MKDKYCCSSMQYHIHKSRMCPNPYDDPDHVIIYVEYFDEYGLIVHDGGASSISIVFCPWCGTKLPESKRELWFEELERIGFDNPLFNAEAFEGIPDKYKSSKWFKEKE